MQSMFGGGGGAQQRRLRRGQPPKAQVLPLMALAAFKGCELEALCDGDRGEKSSSSSSSQTGGAVTACVTRAAGQGLERKALLAEKGRLELAALSRAHGETLVGGAFLLVS